MIFFQKREMLLFYFNFLEFSTIEKESMGSILEGDFTW